MSSIGFERIEALCRAFGALRANYEASLAALREIVEEREAGHIGEKEAMRRLREAVRPGLGEVIGEIDLVGREETWIRMSRAKLLAERRRKARGRGTLPSANDLGLEAKAFAPPRDDEEFVTEETKSRPDHFAKWKEEKERKEREELERALGLAKASSIDDMMPE